MSNTYGLSGPELINIYNTDVKLVEIRIICDVLLCEVISGYEMNLCSCMLSNENIAIV